MSKFTLNVTNAITSLVYFKQEQYGPDSSTFYTSSLGSRIVGRSNNRLTHNPGPTTIVVGPQGVLHST